MIVCTRTLSWFCILSAVLRTVQYMYVVHDPHAGALQSDPRVVDGRSQKQKEHSMKKLVQKILWHLFHQRCMSRISPYRGLERTESSSELLYLLEYPTSRRGVSNQQPNRPSREGSDPIIIVIFPVLQSDLEARRLPTRARPAATRRRRDAPEPGAPRAPRHVPALYSPCRHPAPRNVAFSPARNKGRTLSITAGHRPFPLVPPPSISHFLLSPSPAVSTPWNVRVLDRGATSCPVRDPRPADPATTLFSRARQIRSFACAKSGLRRRWPLLHPSPSADNPCLALSRRPPSEQVLPHRRLPRLDCSRRTILLHPPTTTPRRRRPLLR